MQSELTREMSLHAVEVSRGERFAFGKNWTRFLSGLNDSRIAKAENSLREMLEVESLEGQRFLDIGSGSGLFSLAARRLGARVHSFDYDPDSVACTRELRRRYSPTDDDWTIAEASILNRAYVTSLGEFDIVYSWGVLHHTGQMLSALENACLPITSHGTLLIAIYNDMGRQSNRWKWIKRTYNRLPSLLQVPFAAMITAPEEAKTLMRALIALRPQDYVTSWTNYDETRGMSRWRDIVDWVGGYPYEVARPEVIFEFCRDRGFTLTRLKCGGVGLGCNEFVFVKNQ